MTVKVSKQLVRAIDQVNDHLFPLSLHW
jgi:hypothetical protein